jgi:hypothetical protein
MHRLDTGFDVTGGRIESSAFFSGTIGELVHGSPARVWSFSPSPDVPSLRRSVTLSAFVSDQVMATDRLSLDLGLRYEGVTGSARDAETGISWQNVLPRAAARWSLPGRRRAAVVGGYARLAHRLALDDLAIGDPAAPTVDVFRWNALAGGTLPLSARGSLVARLGPGTNGDPAFSAIDPALPRPTADEFVGGIETRPRDNLLVRLIGVARTARNLPAVVNVGAPIATAYFSFPIENPGNVNAGDDQRALTVFNRLPASFGQDRYLLTSPPRENASFRGLAADVQLNASNLTLVASVAAGRASADAANTGPGPIENDVSTLGELFVNPNAGQLARGRPFADRTYVLKVAGVYRFPADVRLGVVVRHQGGQPFAPVVVFPGLNQGADAVRISRNGEARFPSISTTAARVQKTFAWGGRQVDAFGDVFNLLGLSNAVEHDLTAISTPSVTAVQPPRTIHIGLRVTF